MYEIHDRDRLREERLLQRPVPRLALAHERLTARRAEVPRLRLSGYHRTEVVAAPRRGHAGPHPRRGRPRRCDRGHVRVRLRGRLRRRSGGGHPLSVAQRPLRTDATDQGGDPRRVAEAGGQVGVRIVLLRRAWHRHQAGHLVLLPGRVMHPSARVRGPHLEPPALDLDDRQRRDIGHPGRTRRHGGAWRLHLPCRDQFGADLLGDPSDVRDTEGDLGQFLKPRRGQCEREWSSPGDHKLAEDGRARAVGVQVQRGASREKNPGDETGRDEAGTSAWNKKPQLGGRT